MIRIVLFLLIFCTPSACFHQGRPKPNGPPSVSYYYWKTTLEPGVLSGDSLMPYSGTDTPVFLRLFDVDYSAGYGGPVPVGGLNVSYTEVKRPIVPVVYITNRVFTQSKQGQLDSLPVKVARRIQARLQELSGSALSQTYQEATAEQRNWLDLHRDSFVYIWSRQFVPEIQIDCDWTPATRDAYFHFLETFKKQPITQTCTLSCTVRLHQFRDRKENGIPPVQRGTLMCYNMSSPRDTATRNAIFDLALLQGYLKDQPEYPFPLDVALPVFSWGAWFRSGEFRGLLSGWDTNTLSDTAYFHTVGSNLYRIRRDTAWGSDYLREGDLVRLDLPDEAAVIAATPLIKSLMSPDSRLLFFDWDTTKKAQYERLVPPILAGF
jgi:hypothetical protein